MKDPIKHYPIGATVTSSGWPFVFKVVGVKIAARRARERLYKVTTNPGWANSLTVIIPVSKLRPFEDLRTDAHA